MNSRIAKADRRSIIQDFMARHGGRYDPRAFVEEVRRSNGQHPAWTWFNWDDARAAEDHRIYQARVFAQDIVVKFSVEQIRRGTVVVVSVEAPAFVSPLDARRSGGGYWSLDPSDPAQMAGFCAEAATSLQAWLRRYSGAVAYAGGSVVALQRQLLVLEKTSVAEASEAA